MSSNNITMYSVNKLNWKTPIIVCVLLLSTSVNLQEVIQRRELQVWKSSQAVPPSAQR